MAKLNSVFTFTGKVDNTVGMTGQNGETYLRKFKKPVNPNTADQIVARTKMSLAGQLSKITPASAIIGISGGSKGLRRQRFVRIIVRNAAMQANNAELEPQKLVFSEGVDAPITLTVTPVTEGTAKGFKAEVSTWPDGVSGALVVFVWSEKGVYKCVDVKAVSVDSPSAQSLNLSEKCNIYTIPMLQADGASRADYLEGVNRITNEGYAVATSLISNGIANLGQSRYATTRTSE